MIISNISALNVTFAEMLVVAKLHLCQIMVIYFAVCIRFINLNFFFSLSLSQINL